MIPTKHEKALEKETILQEITSELKSLSVFKKKKKSVSLDTLPLQKWQ